MQNTFLIILDPTNLTLDETDIEFPGRAQHLPLDEAIATCEMIVKTYPDIYHAFHVTEWTPSNIEDKLMIVRKCTLETFLEECGVGIIHKLK